MGHGGLTRAEDDGRNATVSRRQGGSVGKVSSSLRFRPILMTAFAFILGVMPLVIATGSGAISRRILGTAVMGGMLASTCIAILIVPATFALIERLSHRGDSEGGEPAPQAEPSA